MSKFDSPLEREGYAHSTTFSSESCLGEYTQMRDRLKKLLSPKNSDDLYELLLLLKNADLFGRDTVSKIDVLFSEISNFTPEDDLTNVELADCFVSTLLSYIDDEDFLELLQNIILHTKNTSLIVSCENRLFELVFVLGMSVAIDKLRNPLGLSYVLLKSSNFFNLKFMTSRQSQDETRVNLGYLLCTQIFNSMLASSSLYTFNFSSNFEQNEVYTYISTLKLDNRNLKEFLNKEYFAKICEQLVFYCGQYENTLKFLENLFKICKFIHSKDISGNKNHRNLIVAILSQRFVNPLFQTDLIITYLENMYNELISTDLKDYQPFSLKFKNTFGFILNSINSNFNEETEKKENKNEEEIGSDYEEENLLKSELFFNMFQSSKEEELLEVYWILETDLIMGVLQSIRKKEQEKKFQELFVEILKKSKNPVIMARALIFKLSLIWSEYQNPERGNYNPITLKIVTMNEQFWYLYELALANLVPKQALMKEVKEYKDDFKDKRCEQLYDFMLNIAIHTDSDCFFIILMEVLRFAEYDFHVIKYSLQMFQSTLLEFFKHNRVKFSRGVLDIVCFCRQYFDWGFMTMLIYSIDCLMTGETDKYAKYALSNGLIDYLTWKLQLETENKKNMLEDNTETETSIDIENHEIENYQKNTNYQRQNEGYQEESQAEIFRLAPTTVAEIFYIINHLIGPTEVVLELFILYNQYLKGLKTYNILLLPLYKGIEDKIKQTERQNSIQRNLEGMDEGDQIPEEINEEYKEKDDKLEGKQILDLSDKTQMSLGPNKDIYGYLMLNEDSELTTSHVVTLIFSGKMAKNVLNAVKLLNTEEGTRPQYILDLILRKFVNKLQQIFLLKVSEEFCIHASKAENISQEEELLVNNLKLLSSFMSGLISLHINNVHIDSIYLVLKTLLECLKSETVFLVEFAMLTFNNIKNVFNYPLFTKEFISDPKVAKFYPNLVKSYKTLANSSETISEIETTLDKLIANEVITTENNVEDKCLKGKITTKGVIIIKKEEAPEVSTIQKTTLTITSGPRITAAAAALQQSPLTLRNYDQLTGICSNVEYTPPKMSPLFYNEQCLMTILNTGVDDFFNTVKIQIQVPENSTETIAIFSTLGGQEFNTMIESLVTAGYLNWLFFLILRYAVLKGETTFGDINSLLQTLGPKMVEHFVMFLTFAVNLFLKYLRSCRLHLVYKKILLICASLIGEFTIARNKPLLLKQLNVRQLLTFSYEKGFLSITVPFVCRLMSYAVKSKLFKLPNPWTFCILSLLNEIKTVKNLKQHLILEINSLTTLLTSNKNQQQSSPLQTSQSSTNMSSSTPGGVITGENLNAVMSNAVGNNVNNVGLHIKELLKHRVLAEFDQSCRFSSNIWSTSKETKFKIPPIHNEIKVLLKRKIVINNKLLSNTTLSNATGTVAVGSSSQGTNSTNNIITSIMNTDLYNLILNAIESCYRESIYIIEKIVPICVSTSGVISKIDFTQDTPLETLKRSITSMTTGLTTSLVNVICKEVMFTILISEIYQSLLQQYSMVVSGVNGTQGATGTMAMQGGGTPSMGSTMVSQMGGTNLTNTTMGTGNITGTPKGINRNTTNGETPKVTQMETFPIFDCILLEYISINFARDNLALVCALVEQLTLELMGRSLDELLTNWTTKSPTNANNISSILYNQFISTINATQTGTGNYYGGPKNSEDLSLLYKKYLSLVPSTIARVERTEKRLGPRFPEFYIVPPVENIPTNLVIVKFDEFEQRLKEAAKYLLMYPPVVPMANCKFLYKCESSSLLLLSFLPKNHQIFTLLWSIHYIIVKSINITESYEIVLNRVLKNIVDSKSVSIASLVNEVELSLLEMLCVDNPNLLNITTAMLPNLTFGKLVIFLRFKLIKIPSLDVYLCNSGDVEFVVKMLYRLIVDSNYITLKDLPISLKFLSKFDKNIAIHSIGEPTKLSAILTKLFAYSNTSTYSSQVGGGQTNQGGSSSNQVDRLLSLRLLFMSRMYIRNRCVVQPEVSKKHINMFVEFLNCESDSETDLFFINFNENPIDNFISSSLLITLYASYQAPTGLGGMLDQTQGTMGKNSERDKEVRRYDGVPRITYGNPSFEYVPLFCKLVNGFIQTDVFILQKVLHILLSALYKNQCLPVFFKIIQSFIFNPNFTFTAHVSLSQFLLYCNPAEVPTFAPFWVQLATSKQLVQSLIQSPVEWPNLSHLLRYVLIYCTSIQQGQQNQMGIQAPKETKELSVESLMENIATILQYLLQICPEFICGYYLSFCEVTTNIRLRNIFTFSTPKNIKYTNPSTSTDIPETAPLSFVNHIQYVLQNPTLKALTDAFISEPSDRIVPLILKELQPEGIVIYYTLYLGYTLPLLFTKMAQANTNSNQQSQTQGQMGMGSNSQVNNASIKLVNCYLLLEKLVAQSKSKLLVSSMLLHLRYPNIVTIRFVSIFKNLFERAENVQELIITSILERMLSKPHPWGIVHLLFQLFKFKKFWTFIQHNKQLEEHLKNIRHLYTN